MDITPLIPADRQVIESYGPTGFRITGVEHRGAVLVFPRRTMAWPVASIEDATTGDFAALVEEGGVEMLLVGCGPQMMPIPSTLRRFLRERGIGLDAMDTGAACRTYNVLLSEDRRVAAALLPGAGRRP